MDEGETAALYFETNISLLLVVVAPVILLVFVLGSASILVLVVPVIYPVV